MSAIITPLPARPVRRGLPATPADPSQTYVPAGNMIHTTMALIETALRAYHVLPHGNAVALEELLLGQARICMHDLARMLDAEQIHVRVPKGAFGSAGGAS